METIMRFNMLDLLVIAGLCLGFLAGWYQGLLRQLLGLAAFYVGLILGAQYHRLLGDWIGSLAPGALWAAVYTLAFLVIFALGTIVFNLIGHSIYSNTRLPFLTTLDGLGGAIFGVLAACLYMIIAFSVLRFAVTVSWLEWEATRQALLAAMRVSSLEPVLIASAPAVFDLIRPWLPTGLPAIFSVI